MSGAREIYWGMIWLKYIAFVSINCKEWTKHYSLCLEFSYRCIMCGVHIYPWAPSIVYPFIALQISISHMYSIRHIQFCHYICADIIAYHYAKSKDYKWESYTISLPETVLIYLIILSPMEFIFLKVMYVPYTFLYII